MLGVYMSISKEIFRVDVKYFAGVEKERELCNARMKTYAEFDPEFARLYGLINEATFRLGAYAKSRVER